MKIAFNYFGEHHEPLKHYARQLGVEYAVCTVPAASKQPGYVRPWHTAAIRDQQREMAAWGMQLAVLEGIKFIDGAKLGRPDRDECIADFCRLLENMSRLGIGTLCYNWMPVFGWFRTRYAVPERGGALVTGFEMADMAGAEPTDAGRVTAGALWENLEYFMEKVVPVAEKCGVRLALHPDDPPVASIAGIDRILTSADAMMRAIDLVPSEFNGITLCQGTFAAMGEDVPETIRRFGKRIAFAHFRDVRGSAESFTETFPDNGMTDMVEAVKAYRDIGYDGFIRLDHTPTLYGENNANPGYGIYGNLYALGYLRGLMESVEKGGNGCGV